MRFLNRISVRSKLYAGFAIVSAALLVAVGVGWMSMLSVSDTVQRGYTRALVAQKTSKLAYNMRVSQAQSAALGHAIKNADGSDMHAGDVAAYRQQAANLAALATAPEDHAAIARFSAQFKKWSALDQKVMSLWKAGDKPAGLVLANGAANDAGDTLSTMLDSYAAAEQAAAQSDKAAAARQAEILMGVFIAIASALAVGVAVLLTRRISGGLKPVQERLNSLADNCLTDIEAALGGMASEGDVSVEVVPVTTPADVDGKDEIAQIATTFNTMLAKAQSSHEAYNAMRLRMAEMARIAGEIGQGDLSANVEVLSERDQFGQAFSGMQGYLRDIAEAAETVSQGGVTVDVKPKSEADVLGTAFAEMQVYLREMVAAAERIAERDLSSTIEPRSERDALGIAFNRMTENVSAVIFEVSAATSRLSAASEQMATSSNEAGQAVEEIANAVGDVAAGAERQARMIEETRTSAHETTEAATQTSQIANEGVAAAEEATSAMRSLADASFDLARVMEGLTNRSEQIDGIVETISTIAAQTQPPRPERRRRGCQGRRAGPRVRGRRRRGQEAGGRLQVGRREHRQPDRRDPDRDGPRSRSRRPERRADARRRRHRRQDPRGVRVDRPRGRRHHRPRRHHLDGHGRDRLGGGGVLGIGRGGLGLHRGRRPPRPMSSPRRRRT